MKYVAILKIWLPHSMKWEICEMDSHDDFYSAKTQGEAAASSYRVGLAESYVRSYEAAMTAEAKSKGGR